MVSLPSEYERLPQRRRKRKGTCDKTALPKEKFEKFIVDVTCQTFASPEVIGGIYYRYTEHPQGNSPSPLTSSDREDMPGKAGTNPNKEKKNYPKSSDSSDLVDLRRILRGIGSPVLP